MKTTVKRPINFKLSLKKTEINLREDCSFIVKNWQKMH